MPRRALRAVIAVLLLHTFAAVSVPPLWGQTVLTGTYDGSTIDDNVKVDASTSVTFTNGTTFSGANATLDDNSILYWNQTGTLSGKTVNLGSTADATISLGSEASLTLDSTTSANGGVRIIGTAAGSSLANQGTITHSFGTGYLYAPTVTNSGTITTTNGATFVVGNGSAGYNTTNTGTVTADNANLYLDGNVANQGTITAQNGGIVTFRDNNTTANLGNVVIGSGGGEVRLNGTLDNTTATLSAPTGGAYELYGGTIDNGSVASGALTFTNSGGTLSGVTYSGDLTLPASTSVTFTNGTTFTGANATLGNSAHLTWNQTGTLSGKTISLGTTGNAYLQVGNSGSLTLDSGTSVTGGVYIYGDSGTTIVNAGTITDSHGTGYLYAPTLTNSGTITATGGATLAVGGGSAGYNTTNSGTITADNATIYLDGNVANQGTVTAQNGGIVTFRDNNTTANLGNVAIGTGGGEVRLNGTLDNATATLSAPTGGAYELYGGTIDNGSIAAGALTFTDSGGTLSNVAVNGDLTLPASTSVTFTDGTTFTGANATLGNGATLNWNQTGTLSAKVITLGTTADAFINVGNNDSLTLDNATTMTGGVYLYGGSGATFTNAGSITQSYGTGYLYTPTLTNSGTITTTSNSTLVVGGSGYATTNSGTLTADGANLYLDGNMANQGTITAQNGGIVTFRYNTTTANLGNVAIGPGGGQIRLAGTLDNTTATLSAPTGGSYELDGGTIDNGSVASGALTFTGNGGILSDVTLDDNLTLPASSSVTFTDGTGFTGANATLGGYSWLFWNQSGTISGKTFTLGSGAYVGVSSGQSVTLDGTTTLQGDVTLYGATGSTMVIQGTISHDLGSGYIYGPNLTNEGTITASSGGSLFFGYYSGESTVNAAGGTITADGASADVYVHDLVNLGTVTAQNGGAVYFDGNNTTSDLGNVAIGAGGGHAYFSGTLDNTDATLAAPAGGSYELSGGTITNGTIAAGALTFTSNGGTLDNAVYTGDLTLPASAWFSLTNGAAFTGANATLGNNSEIYWNQSGTLAGKSLTFGTGADIYLASNAALTLASDTTATGNVTLYTYNGDGASITNQGSITNSSGYGSLYAPMFTNEGSITADSASNLYLGSSQTGYTFTNTATGSITVAGNATITLQGPVANEGLVDVRSGWLEALGNLSNAATGTIQGAGKIYGDLTMAGGFLSPGTAGTVGTLTFTNGAFSVTGAATLKFDINGATSDQLVFSNPSGVVGLGDGLLTLELNLLSAPTPGSTYNLLSLVSSDYGYSGYFAGLLNNGDTLTANYLGNPYRFTIDYLSDGVTLDFTPVPEPPGYLLLGLGLAVLGLAARRRRATARPA